LIEGRQSRWLRNLGKWKIWSCEIHAWKKLEQKKEIEKDKTSKHKDREKKKSKREGSGKRGGGSLQAVTPHSFSLFLKDVENFKSSIES
jgi:hypothetical protein